ncbi:MAG: PHP domain-containing protein [Treponema sp.]|jgi:histidinol phosphatase-like PHP family hydrolase|nr:PHP domain-containing protein [Treponema sp.]
MVANYHTHTRWCRHGSGEIEEYIRAGIEGGLRELAFTEHIPLPGDPDRLRMRCDELDAFDRDLNDLIAKYASAIRIRKGLECEYYPDLLEYYEDLRDRLGYEILLLGQHTSTDRRLDYFAISRPKDIGRYADEVCRGLETGFFTFLAHPDVPINSYLNPDRPFMDAMARIFRLCEERDIPVEINANGQGRRRGYPCREVWELARNYKLRVLVCADAHHVPDLICKSVTQCEDLARELNLNLISLLP